MDWGPLGQIIGGIGLAGGLVLALLRYLTSDSGYRDLISEQRAELSALRDEVRELRDALEQASDERRRAAERERELITELKIARAAFHPPPPPGWAPPEAGS